MFNKSDHFSNASQENAQAQLALSAALGRKALESTQRLIDLHIGFAKASMQDAAVVTRQMLTARNGQEAMTLALTQAQPVSRKMLAYGCHVAGIAAGTQAELIELCGAQCNETGKETIQLAEDVSRHAPPGMNGLGGMMRTGLDIANAGIELTSTASKQALEMLETNLITVANQLARV